MVTVDGSPKAEDLHVVFNSFYAISSRYVLAILSHESLLHSTRTQKDLLTIDGIIYYLT